MINNKIIIKIIIILGCLFSAIFVYQKYTKVVQDRDIAENNIKAIAYKEPKNQAIEYKLQADQLKYINDSLITKLDSVRKLLKLKDKNLKSMAAISTTSLRLDTVLLNDTIFKNDIHLDTILGDKWFSNRIILNYPNEIVSEPSFINNEYLIWHIKKETVKPPSKYWVFRLFQRKHTVVEVEVIEENPYVTVKSKRFINIIK